jgi:hypothetical protein
MKVITDIKLEMDWPYITLVLLRQEIRVDDSGAIVSFGEPEETEELYGP